MTDFLKMGGYAAYVWSAYGITLAVLGFSIWAARRRRLDALARARAALRQESSHRQAKVREIE